MCFSSRSQTDRGCKNGSIIRKSVLQDVAQSGLVRLCNVRTFWLRYQISKSSLVCLHNVLAFWLAYRISRRLIQHNQEIFRNLTDWPLCILIGLGTRLHLHKMYWTVGCYLLMQMMYMLWQAFNTNRRHAWRKELTWWCTLLFRTQRKTNSFKKSCYITCI